MRETPDPLSKNTRDALDGLLILRRFGLAREPAAPAEFSVKANWQQLYTAMTDVLL